MPSYCHTQFMDLAKMRTLLIEYGEQSLFRSVCVTTIGVCIFQCADFGWHTFLFLKGAPDVKKLLVLFFIALLLSHVLCACADNSTSNNPNTNFETTNNYSESLTEKPTDNTNATDFDASHNDSEDMVEIAVDYPDVAEFELDLNNGKDLTGKTVTFEVIEFVPDSAFGYNLQAGEHLNFCSPKHPGVNEGDIITVKVTSISSMLGSYIISYEIVD